MAGALSSGDLAKLRTRRAHATRLFLSVVPPAAIFSAQIAQSSFTYPLAQLAYDNAAGDPGDVQPGMTVHVGTSPGGNDVFVGRVRKPPVGNVLYINETSRADTGYTTARHRPFAAGQHITVLNSFDLWYAFPRIVYAGGEDAVFYKDYDLEFTPGPEGQGAKPPPVANIGPFRAQRLHGGAPAVERFSAAASFAVSPGRAIVGWAWDFADGDPAASDQETPGDVAFASEGFRWVRCTVTDSNGKTHSARAGVWTHGPSYAPLRVLEVEGDTRTRQGRRMSVRVHPDDAPAIPHGALAMVWEEASWGGEAVPEATTRFVGWVLRERARVAPGASEISFEILGPGELWAHVTGVSQRVEAAASPANWTQVLPELCTPDFVTWYLLHWHLPVLLELFDLHLSGTGAFAFRRNAFRVPPGRVLAQLQGVASQINANIGADSAGAIWMRRDPQYLTEAARDARAVRMTLTPADLVEIAGREREGRRRVGSVLGEGFLFTASGPVGLLARAPGKSAIGQGPDEETLEGQTVSSAADLRARTGHHYARANNPYPEVAFKLNRNLDVFEPAHMEWVALDVPAAHDARGEGIAGRFLPARVVVNYDAPGSKALTLTAEAETWGEPGEDVPIPVQAAGPEISIEIDWPQPQYHYLPTSLNLPVDLLPTKLSALLANGHVARATAYAHPAAPVWEDVTGAMTGACTAGGDMVADKFDPQAYVVSTADGIWWTDNLWGDPPAWTLVNDGTGSKNLSKIVNSIRQDGWWAGLYIGGWPGGSGQSPSNRVYYTHDDWATIDVGALPTDGSGRTLYPLDIETVQGGRDAGAGSGVQLMGVFMDLTGWNAVHLCYSGDGGATWTRRAQIGRVGDAISGLIVPVFLPDGTWNTDGDVLFVSTADQYGGPGNRIKKSVDGGVSFTVQIDNVRWHGRWRRAGVTQDINKMAIMHRNDLADPHPPAGLYFTDDMATLMAADGGAGWAVHASDHYAGCNGYSYHLDWVVYWRNQVHNSTPADVRVTADFGLTSYSIVNNLWAVTGITPVDGQSQALVVQADISDVGGIFQWS